MASNGVDPGHGPPPGSFPGIPLKDFAEMFRVAPDVDDPAAPLLDKGTKGRVSTVLRQLPLVTIQNTWTVEQARGALYGHMMGMFESSSQLFDSILGDDRVMATMGSRVSGLFGRDVIFRPANDSDAAKEVLDAWAAWWPKLSGDASRVEMHTYGIGMGFSPAQLIWDTSGPIWGPYLRPWHTRFTYFNWADRRLTAFAQDGTIPIVPGNGKWVLHAPFGEYRGWIRGAIRALAEPWMLRHFALRDMARFSEIHGLPTRVGKVPAVGDPGLRAEFETALAQLGSDSSMIVPQGVDGQQGTGYDYALVEATDTAWESFPGMMDRCDMAIVLAILFQNLTTEVKGGSFAAVSGHMDIRQDGLQFDDASWTNTMAQVARPFAMINFGDPDLAPITCYDVTPRADLAGNASQFQLFGTALELIARGGYEFASPDDLVAWAVQRFGLAGMPALKKVAPPAAATGGSPFGGGGL